MRESVKGSGGGGGGRWPVGPLKEEEEEDMRERRVGHCPGRPAGASFESSGSSPK